MSRIFSFLFQRLTLPKSAVIVVASFGAFATPAFATTKGLSQIVTPDLQPEGDFSLSFQAQSERIANPYQLQGELGLTKWAEVAVFKGFKPNELIFGTEFGLIQKEPYLLSVGFVNWSPHSHVDPQPYVEAGYYLEHQKFIVGAIRVDYRNEAILGYAYDFNKTWRAQVDFKSGSGNSSTIGVTCNITRDLQVNPAIYFPTTILSESSAMSFSPIHFISGAGKRGRERNECEF